LKRSETAETISQNHKQIERLMPNIPSETPETTAITEGGLSAPPWSFRFTPFLGGETVKRETEMAPQHERRQEAQVSAGGRDWSREQEGWENRRTCNYIFLWKSCKLEILNCPVAENPHAADKSAFRGDVS
jgi:hypothetical protein